MIGRLERRYLLHVPKGYEAGKAVPLVVMLHGMGGTAILSQRETGLSDKGDAEGFIVVYPEATRPDPLQPASLRSNPQAWNDGSGRFHSGEQNIDDVGFLRSLIDELSKEYSIDQDRVFVTGFSNGASMTFRIGAELADRVAAIAPHSGTCWTESIKPLRSISVCYLTGTADTLNPIEGGFPRLALGGQDQGGRSKPPVMSMITKWAKAIECDEKPVADEESNGVRKLRYGSGRGQSQLLYITVDGLGHHWAGGKSQAPGFLVGRNTDKLKATDVIWTFFQATVGSSKHSEKEK
ncbi:MAG: alpha/beta hydrolase-fold protein [Pirellula sp.]|nr:alpha/beta hydrolase-fold protein [Pirellula sp.]